MVRDTSRVTILAYYSDQQEVSLSITRSMRLGELELLCSNFVGILHYWEATTAKRMKIEDRPTCIVSDKLKPMYFSVTYIRPYVDIILSIPLLEPRGLLSQ